jgi:hypothetical protein
VNFHSILRSYFLVLFAAAAATASAQTYDGSGLRIGYSYGMYTYQMSGPEIYCAQFNAIALDTSQALISFDDAHSSFRNFHGASVSYQLEPTGTAEKVCLELGWNMRFRSSDGAYTYEPVPGGGSVQYKERLKMSTNMVYMTIGYRPTGKRLMFGVGMDLGMLRTKRKFTDAGGSMSKWQPWFFTIGVLRDDPKPSTPIAAYTLSAAYDFSAFTLRIAHTRPVLDGEMLSQTGKYTNLPWSSKRFPITHTMVSLYLHIN